MAPYAIIPRRWQALPATFAGSAVNAIKHRATNLRRSTERRLFQALQRRAFGRGLIAMWRGLRRHHMARNASAMAFDLFLAAIPMLALAGWVVAVALRTDQRALGMTSLLLDLTPIEVHELASRHLGRFSPGAVAPIAVLGSIWLASSAFHTLMSVFETAIGARRRAWWQKRMLAIGCVFGAIVAFAATGFLAVELAGGPSALLRLISATEYSDGTLGRALAAAFSVCAITATLAAFFRVAVHRPDVARRVWPGAALSVAIGGLSSYLFGYYAQNLASFTLYYGSLTAVAIVLAWLWIWCAALLVGAELNAQLEGGDRGLPSVRAH
jgi:membrane protein